MTTPPQGPPWQGPPPQGPPPGYPQGPPQPQPGHPYGSPQRPPQGPPSGPPPYQGPQFPGPQYPGQFQQGTAPRRKLWPWLLGGGALLLAVVLVLLFMVRGGSQASALGSTELTTYEGERINFQVLERWRYDPQDNVTTLRPGYTTFDSEVWTGWDPASDAEAREVLSYYYFGQMGEPNTQEIPPERIDDALNQGVSSMAGLGEAELLSWLRTVGHGCVQDPYYLGEPERFDPNGLKGVLVEFECAGGISGQLALRGRQLLVLDPYGDRHEISFTTDRENADDLDQALDEIFGSVTLG